MIAGFRFAGVAAGIKSKGGLDLGLAVCDRPASAAAVFTQNQVAAAPVLVSRAALAASRGRAQAIVVNSGNANAATGRQGLADARAMATRTGAAAAVPRGRVLVASTGVIGVPLPMAKLDAGIARAAAALAAAGEADFAQAILTTDRARKVAAAEVVLGATRARIWGCTKGAGMIAPNMATTLSFVFTDAAIAPVELGRALRAACAESFNAITVDGDTSTNDMIAVLASGAAGNRAAGRGFGAALAEVLGDLARQLMRGGEGVHHVVTVRVRGAARTADAARVARRIANSPLVKTAIAGADPNWGRILAAAGNAGVALRPDRIGLALDDVAVLRRGAPLPAAAWEAPARAVMSRPEYAIVLDLGGGRAEASYLACDLSHEYVTINADYRT